jgi:5-methylcytosine-specific restriction protein A
MPWSTSNRRSSLPADWPAIRRRILRRDNNSCQWRESDGSSCGREANEVDHIQPSGSDEEWNLRSLCSWHHQRKSSAEGAAANIKHRREIANRFRLKDEHPGVISS